MPPFWGSDGWYNASVEDYPFDPDFSTPNAILNAAGFADANGDGWRDLPDGTVMQTLTILTPPADYDPVRIRAGEMIAKNMRDGLNINAEAKALDFDTLVTRLQSMDYQMLIIGWSLSSEPVGNVFDIIGPYASSNTFGFWSEANPNPYYADLFGVVTRADAETQALADEVLRLEDLAKASFNISNQISYTRWAQGVIARAAPVDVLYYRVNVEAATSRWVGWLSYMGQIFGPGMNLFSLGNLVYSGEWTGYREVTQGLNAGLSMPSEVSMVTSAQGYVMAIDDLGRPVEGASVTLSVTGYMGGPTVTPTPWGGMTDSSGVFSFSVAGVEEGYSEITATVTLGILSCSDSAFVECVLPVPNTLSLTISSDKHILRPGELANVVAEVTDEWGASVEDATVFVDENLLSYGSVNWTSGSALTDASGRAYLQYQAPTIISPYLNTHLELMLSFTATKNGFEWPAAGSANLMVLNEDPSDWTMTQVDASVTGAVSLARAANATSIVVMVTDDDGNPLWNYRLEIRYSAVDLLFNPVDWVFTDVTGHATIDVQFKDSPTSSALRVTIGNWTVLNAVPATVTLTYAGDGPVPTMYGGYMIWDVDYDPATQEPQFVAPVGSITAVAYVWDGTGAPADGVDSALIVSGTPYGTLAWCDLINWDSTWDGWGINIITQQDGANLVTSGPFNTPYDYDDWDYWYNTAGYIYWDWGTMTGVQILGGELAIEIYGFDVAPIDLMSQVYLVPGGMCYFSDITYCYQLEGSTVISSDYVLGRTYDVLATEILIDDPVLEARSSAYDETGVGVWVTDENNLPVEGVDARVYENVLTGNRNYKVYPWAGANQWSSGYIVTDVNGYANATITAVAKYSVIAEASLRADVYAKAFSWGGYSLLTQTQLAIHVRPCFVTIDPMPDVYLLGDLVRINATVMDSSGVPLENMTVSLVAGTATILDSEEVTDASGRVAFWVFTSSITNDTAGFMLVIGALTVFLYTPDELNRWPWLIVVGLLFAAGLAQLATSPMRGMIRTSSRE